MNLFVLMSVEIRNLIFFFLVMSLLSSPSPKIICSETLTASLKQLLPFTKYYSKLSRVIRPFMGWISIQGSVQQDFMVCTKLSAGVTLVHSYLPGDFQIVDTLGWTTGHSVLLFYSFYLLAGNQIQFKQLKYSLYSGYMCWLGTY